MPALLLRAVPLTFVVLWSTGFIAAKYGAAVAGPFSLLAARMVLVVAVLGTLGLVLRRPWPSRTTALHAMFVGALLHAFYLGGVFWSVKHGLPAGFSALIVGLQPMLTALFARPVLGERVTLRHGIGLALGFAGVAMVLAPRFSGGLDGVTPVTVGAAFLGVCCIAYGTVHQKRFVVSRDLVTSTVLQYVGAAVVLVPLAAAEGFRLTPGLQLYAVLAWLVFGLSIGAVMLLLAMIEAGQVSKVAALLYLVPPTTALMAFVLFGDQLSALQIAGSGLVVAAVALATRL